MRSRPVDRPLARYAAAGGVAALLLLAILVGMVWAVQAPGRFEGLIRRAIEVTYISPETAPSPER